LADARDQLRRYLEQRREMGESELVLDTLSVDEALRMLGARTTTAGPTTAGARPTDPRPDIRQEPSLEPRTSGGVEPSVDWRDALRATGAAPDESVKKKIGRFEFPAAQTAAPTFASPFADVPAGLSVGASGEELLGGSMTSLMSLQDIAAHITSCTRCPLYATATNAVPGEGNPQADLMCVGEAPGATEDETGRPFVGAAGQLLSKILEAIKLPREQVFIANVLKHRPPGNRNPMPLEVSACSPYLVRQIELVRPKVIIALGTFAAQTLLQTQLSLGKLRGQIHRYYGVPLIVTYHPAALLRNPSWKRPTWEDVQLARRILDSANPGA
jgi:uracil-DNA glycosylase family 4